MVIRLFLDTFPLSSFLCFVDILREIKMYPPVYSNAHGQDIGDIWMDRLVG